MLVVGHDTALLRTREAILRGAGYAATAIEVDEGLPEDAANADLIVLCQTLHERKAELLRKSLTDKGSQAKFLQFVKHPSDDQDSFCSLEGPTAFLAKVAGVLKSNASAVAG